MANKSRAEIQAWKQQLVHQAEIKLQALTTSTNFKAYLKTMVKFHHYSLRNINLIYAKIPRQPKWRVLNNGKKILAVR